MKKEILVFSLVLTVLAATCAAAGTAELKPSQVVDGFYRWYFKNTLASDGRPIKGLTWEKKFSQAKDYFSPELYGLLSDAIGGFDCNPFTGIQVSSTGYRIGKTEIEGPRAVVKVVILSDTSLTGGPGRGIYETPLSVEVIKSEGAWRISDFLLPGRDSEYGIHPWLKRVIQNKHR